LSDNQHFERAKSRLHNGTTNEVARAQAEAALALAHEQRTANLIALYALEDGWQLAINRASGMTRSKWDDVANQIVERLGLK
jgi:hypothetical protein